MTNSTVLNASTAQTKRTDQNAVYKQVVREMKTLQSTVESPSGGWTLIRDKTPATGGLSQKSK